MEPGPLADLAARLLGHDPVGALAAMVAVLARVGPAIWVCPLPPGGGYLVPWVVKIGLSLLLALALAPAMEPEMIRVLAAASPASMLAAVLAKEVLLGAALGFVTGLVLWGAAAAGSLADTARGAAGLGEGAGGGSSLQGSPLASLMTLLTVVLFVLLKGHLVFIQVLDASYQAAPLFSFPTLGGLADLARTSIRLTADLILLAVTLSAPVLGALFIADLALGLAGRMAPRLDLPLLALPLRAVAGLVVVLLFAGLLTEAVPEALDLALEQAARLARTLGGP